MKIYYHVQNGGDGSASTQFHQTKKQAEKADKGQSEGWGESSVGALNLKIEDGKLFFETRDEDWKTVWKEVK